MPNSATIPQRQSHSLAKPKVMTRTTNKSSRFQEYSQALPALSGPDAASNRQPGGKLSVVPMLCGAMRQPTAGRSSMAAGSSRLSATSRRSFNCRTSTPAVPASGSWVMN